MATERRPFTNEEIEAAWQKAESQPNNNPDVFRKDYAGAWIRRDQYGRQTDYGWEIDHIRPLASDGSYDITNLEPMQWENNRHKGDDYPKWNTCKSSNGTVNVDMERSWYVKN